MKVQLLTALFAITGSSYAHDLSGRHGKRQNPPVGSSSASTPPSGSSSVASSTGSAAPTGSLPPPPVGPSGVSTSLPAVPTGPYATLTASNAPPLASITFGATTGPLVPLATTYPPGTQPTVISEAPPIPSFGFVLGEWPQPDKAPDPNSPEVQEWMKELEGFSIPDWSPTVDGSCVNDTQAASESAARGWWTCGAHTRDTDIVACPDKLTWGVSFDDGPSPWTPALLNYLDQQNIKSTFFVVGSRVIQRPEMLVTEYMSGHEIAVHTWSHPHLTALSNEAIVAELGWTRKAIKDVIGVTPVYMRPPYGDIDDRVRAISLAMGLIPIVWTNTPATGPFDTNDWKVAGGIVTGVQQYESFQNILGNASLLDTGMIVLSHDLYEISVDLAIGYELPAALSHNPPFTLKAIGECMGYPAADMYLETTGNTTFPFTNATGIDVDGDGKLDTKSKSQKNAGTALLTASFTITTFAVILSALLW